MCGRSLTDSMDYTTNWTVLLAFNSILFLVLAVCIVLMCLTCLVWPIGCIGIIGNCFGCCAYLAAIIVSFVFRYSTEGEQCAATDPKAADVIYNEDGDTFNINDHADMITGLVIT